MADEIDERYGSKAKCKACGGPDDDELDAYVRRTMGCDAPIPDGRTILLPDGSSVNRCPRSLMRAASRYMVEYQFYENGQLELLHEELPADRPEAFLLISHGLADSRERSFKKAQRKH